MDYAKLGAELYQIVRLAFLQSVAGNLLGTIQGEIEAGTATYAQALAFASDSGRILAALMREQMAPGVIPDDIMHAEIAENMITPLMTDQYALVAEVCVQVQQNLNDRYGVNLAPQRPAFREERADGIARSVSGRPVNDIGPSFDNAVENYSMSVVDDSVRTNAEFQYEAGFEPQIIRSTADVEACDWCKDLVGIYEYSRVRRTGSDVFRRHGNCRCLVEFRPGNGRRQNVHDRTWRRETEEERNSRINNNMTDSDARASGMALSNYGDYGDKPQTYKDRGIEVPDHIVSIQRELRDAGQYLVGNEMDYSREDLRILSHEEGVEFCRLSAGSKTYLVRGTETGVRVPDSLISILELEDGRLDYHSHVYVGDVTPSMEDIAAIRTLNGLTGQNTSEIISVDGQVCIFSANGIIETSSLRDEESRDIRENTYRSLFDDKP